MRKYVRLEILRSIYFAIFESQCCVIWAQNSSTIQGIVILQKKAVRINNCQPRNSHTSPLLKENWILNFQDKICLENILFPCKYINDLSPKVFNRWFSFFQINILSADQLVRCNALNVKFPHIPHTFQICKDHYLLCIYSRKSWSIVLENDYSFCLTLSNCKRLAIINIQVNFTATAMSNSYFMTNIPQSLLITVVLYAENSRLEAENV